MARDRVMPPTNGPVAIRVRHMRPLQMNALGDETGRARIGDGRPAPINSMIEREILVRAIRERPEQIVVLEAAAGMGKSVLLGQVARHLDAEVVFDRSIAPASGTVLWDLGTRIDAAPLDEAFVSGGHRLVVAKRPECAIPGLSRAYAYRTAFRLDPASLLFSTEDLRRKFDAKTARRILAASGGWPALADPLLDEAGMRMFFEKCLLADMPAAILIGLGEMLKGRPVPADIRAALNPVVIEGPQGETTVVAPALEKPLRAAQARTEHVCPPEPRPPGRGCALLPR